MLAYWINGWLWDRVLYDALGMAPDDRLTETIHFFLYDTIKITLLLVGIIFVITVLRSYMSIERTRALLGGKREGVGNVMAAGLGVVTPFCSCSAVPAFIGFVAAGVPIGVTLSFLIASPLVNEIAIGMLFSLFGWQVTAVYIAAGLTIAIVAGWVLGKMGVEKWVEPFVFETRLGGQVIDSSAGLTFDQRIQMGVEEVATILRKIWPYLLVGIGLGAVIHGWVPADFFTTYAGPGNAFGVVVAVGIGVPLYSNAAGIMPMVQALYEKGLPMGTLLAFMMAVVALSLPEMILLRRVLKPQLLGAFVGVVATGIVAVGYLFNFILAT
ncbi:MAG: permease [Actinomycetes bacterium]